MGMSQPNAPAALYTRGNAPGTHWTEGCVGPRAGLDIEARGYGYQIAYSYTNMKIMSINAQHMFTLPPQLYRTYYTLYCVATWVKHSTVVPWYQRISSQRCSPLNSFGRRPPDYQLLPACEWVTSRWTTQLGILVCTVTTTGLRIHDSAFGVQIESWQQHDFLRPDLRLPTSRRQAGPGIIKSRHWYKQYEFLLCYRLLSLRSYQPMTYFVSATQFHPEKRSMPFSLGDTSKYWI
jgi:hypothetical protein